MRFFKSIRWQLSMWHGLLLLVVICAFGFTAYQLERAERMQSVDAELQHRLSLLVSLFRGRPPEPSTEPPQFDEKRVNDLVASSALKDQFGARADYYFVVWMRGSHPVARSSNAPSTVPRPTERDAASRVRDGEFRESFIFAAPVDCVLVGRSITDVNANVRFHALLLSTAGGVLLALGLAVGWWLTSRALRPIHAISDAAKQIAEGDLSRRINVSQTESELGELAAVLNSTFARLDAAFAQQARFTSDAAHELRTPVTVLLTQTQAALARERNAAEYRDVLAANQAASQRMRRLIDSLLELARFDAGHEPLRRGSCDLAQIAEDGIELMRPLCDGRRIAICGECAAAKCHGDPDRMAQVVTNLVTNAIEYNREGGEVRITTFLENGEAVLTVADNGPGISEEDLPHIFERFYRADKSRSGVSPRTGLGLAISKAIVEAHGGTLAAESTAGHGTKFTLRVPADV